MSNPGDLRTLIEQLVLSNQQQQIRHEEQMRVQLRSTETMRAEFQQLLHIKETQTQEVKANPARFLIKQTPEDDVETYLLTFERTAQREDWPENQWVSLLAPFLFGVAQTAYQDTAADPGLTYRDLKAEILSRYGVSLISRAQRFRGWKYDSAISSRAQMHDLIRLANGWLMSEPRTLGPLERVVMDHYMRALPYEAKKMVCQGNPQTVEQMVKLLEGYQAAQGVLRGNQLGSSEPQTQPREKSREEVPPRRRSPVQGRRAPETGRRRPLINPDRRRCYDCGEEGHLAWNCPLHGDVTMPSASEPQHGQPCGLLTACWATEDSAAPLTPVTANGKDTSALLDSGSNVTLIRPEFVAGPLLTATVGVTCIHGETRQYPTTRLELKTTKGRCTGPAGVVPDLPVAVLIGRDRAVFRPLWRSLAGETRRPPRGLPAQPRVPKTRTCGFQEADLGSSTEPRSEETINAAIRVAEETGREEEHAGGEAPQEEEEGDTALGAYAPEMGGQGVYLSPQNEREWGKKTRELSAGGSSATDAGSQRYFGARVSGAIKPRHATPTRHSAESALPVTVFVVRTMSGPPKKKSLFKANLFLLPSSGSLLPWQRQGQGTFQRQYLSDDDD